MKPDFHALAICGLSVLLIAVLVAGTAPSGFLDYLILLTMPLAIDFVYAFLFSRPLQVSGGILPPRSETRPVVNLLARAFYALIGMLLIAGQIDRCWQLGYLSSP